MRSKREKKGLSVLIVVSRPGSARKVSVGRLATYDHVAWINPEHLFPQKGVPESSGFRLEPDQSASSFGSLFWSIKAEEKKIHHVVLAASGGTSSELNAVLDTIWPHLTEDFMITIGGFSIRSDQFKRIVSRCDQANFSFCRFGRGWWQAMPQVAACTYLTMESCSGVSPRSLEAGQAAWNNLTYLQVLGPKRREWGYIREFWISGEIDIGRCDRFAQEWLTAMWGQSITLLSVDQFASNDFVGRLPTRPSLKHLDLGLEVSEGLFEWMIGNENLRNVSLNWRPEITLPWHLLSHLKRLVSLSVISSPLDDEELAVIAESSTLKALIAYYTKLTAASWSTLLTWPSLKQFWGSSHMISREAPLGLPETTALEEVVALNADTGWFANLLERYPGVKVVSM